MENDNRKYSLYKHIAPNGKVYIGITKQTVKKRWLNGHGYQSQILFWRAIVKYGWNNFKHEILFENLTKEEAGNKEMELIAYYKKLKKSYNISDGGDSIKGYKISKEIRKKISDKMKGNHNIGSGGDHVNAKTVYQYDLNGNFIKKWDCIESAAKFYNICSSNITACCRSRTRSSNGFIWKYNFTSIDSYKRVYYNQKKIDQFNNNGNLLNTFESCAEIERLYGYSTSNIIRCCKGKTKKAYGFIWKYHNG